MVSFGTIRVFSLWFNDKKYAKFNKIRKKYDRDRSTTIEESRMPIKNIYYPKLNHDFVINSTAKKEQKIHTKLNKYDIYHNITPAKKDSEKYNF